MTLALRRFVAEYPVAASELCCAMDNWSEESRQKFYKYADTYGVDEAFAKKLSMLPASEVGVTLDLMAKQVGTAASFASQLSLWGKGGVCRMVSEGDMRKLYSLLAGLPTCTDIRALIVTGAAGVHVDTFDAEGLKEMLIAGVNEYIETTGIGLSLLPGGGLCTDTMQKACEYVAYGKVHYSYTGIVVVDVLTGASTEHADLGPCVEAAICLACMATSERFYSGNSEEEEPSQDFDDEIFDDCCDEEDDCDCGYGCEHGDHGGTSQNGEDMNVLIVNVPGGVKIKISKPN